MKCFEEIFSGSIDCNWRNVSAGGLIAQNRVGKISHTILGKKQFLKQVILLKLCVEILLNRSKYIPQKKSTFEEEEKTILS